MQVERIRTGDVHIAAMNLMRRVRDDERLSDHRIATRLRRDLAQKVLAEVAEDHDVDPELLSRTLVDHVDTDGSHRRSAQRSGSSARV